MHTKEIISDEDIVDHFEGEIVAVIKGKHKGRIAYCDENASNKKCYINFGDPLITFNYEITIPVKSLRMATVDLSNAGHSPWLDEFEILVGQSIPQEISVGLQDCDFVFVLLSNNSVKSHWVEREWQTKYWSEVETGNIKVIPILIENCEIPELLKTKKYANFTENNYSSSLDNVLLALNNYSK